MIWSAQNPRCRHGQSLMRLAVVASLFACTTAPLIARQATNNQFARPATDANSAWSEQSERLALLILQQPAVKQSAAAGLARFRASDTASKPDGVHFAQSAIDNTAALAAYYTALGAGPEPTFGWLFSPPRRWHGYTFPGTRWYGDNADTLYRAARVEASSTYEVALYPGKSLPAQISVMLYDQLMYENGMNERLDIPPTSFEVTAETPRNRDGSITLTIGPDPAHGRANHLQMKPGVKQIFVREIKGDWAQSPVRLAIRRTKGSAPAARTLDQLAAEAATMIASAVNGTINIEMVFGKLADNQLAPPRVRWIEDTGSPDQKLVTDELLGPDRVLGFVSGGQFNLRPDEALVMTLSTMGTRYLSVNAYRPFVLSPEHVYRTSSLNNSQAQANPDGTYTFVFALSDPGVFNWIDTNGVPFGSIAVRWQTLTHPVSATLANGVKEVRVVKLADLRKELPASTHWVSPAERKTQQAERAREYRLRCLGTPCQVGGPLDRLY